jgi:pimeloyl-ACP methyl ester carboxylesterase
LRVFCTGVSLVSLTGATPYASAQASGTVVTTPVELPALEGNLVGEPAHTTVRFYLPPSPGHTVPGRPPVVYLLHSYGSSGESWLDGSYEGMDLAGVLDGLIGSGAVGPMLVVMPDAGNRFGGSWYADSPATGRWERAIAGDLADYVDRTYTTSARRGCRGIAGQSMGGYGALRIAMDHAGVFSAALAMSAVNLVNPDPLGEAAQAMALDIEGDRLADLPIPGRVIWSKAAAFSPNRQAPPLYADLPYRRTEAGLTRLPDVWQRWRAATLAQRFPARLDALRSLTIRLEAGSRDPLREESTVFAERLIEHDVPHTHVVFQGDHVAGVRGQFERSVFQFFDAEFAAAGCQGSGPASR